MPFQPVGNGAEVVIKSQYEGQDCFTTMGFLGIVGFTQAQLQVLVDEVGATWAEQMLPILPGSYNMGLVTGKGLRIVGDVTAEYDGNLGDTGGLAGDTLPNNCSLAVSWRTGLTGRSYRGRNFWPGFVEADVTHNTVGGTRRTSILAAYATLKATVEGPGVFLMAIISRWQDKALRPSGVCIPITGFAFTDNTIDSQRRRLPGRGR